MASSEISGALDDIGAVAEGGAAPLWRADNALATFMAHRANRATSIDSIGKTVWIGRGLAVAGH